MNYFRQIYRQQPLLAALVLTVLLPLGAGMFFLILNAVYPNLSSTAKVSNNHQYEKIATQPTQEVQNLPDSVVQGVLQDAAKRLNVPTQELRIVQPQQRDWPDGCLGLASSDTFCTQIMVSGWQVMVEGKQKNLVYRTNNSGSIVKLAEE